MESAIELKDVWKRYEMKDEEDGLIVLKEINLEIKKGEFIAIVGPSGSGKSTIMHMLGTLDIPSFGEIRLKNESVKDMKENTLAAMRGKTIGFIFQQFNLLQTFNALENVMMPMELVNIPEKLAKKRAEELLTQMGLKERLHHRPSQLSGGQQQRVAIARALANEPDIILADEPTGNLDSQTGEFVMNFLKELNKKGKTIILVTHEMNLVKHASHIVYIKDGRIEKETNDRRKK